MWNPDQYERFKQERRQPFEDLMALVEKRPHMRIVDLGCGTGELTRSLHDHLGADETVGVDNSETMLLKTQVFGTDVLRFERGDIEVFVADKPFDLIFSNAALHWVPNHESLLHRLASFLSPHGQLAIQMPANDDHPSHVVAAEIARSFGVEPRPDQLLPIDEYARILHHLGFKRQHVRMQVYGHLLDSTAAIVDWVKGALLTDYERRLGDRYDAFLGAYTSHLREVLPDRHPYFYTYKRVLIWGTF